MGSYAPLLDAQAPQPARLPSCLPERTLQGTDQFRLGQYGCIKGLSAFLRYDILDPGRTYFHHITLGWSTGVKVVRGHHRRSSRMVCDRGAPAILTGVNAASDAVDVDGMEARMPCVIMC